MTPPAGAALRARVDQLCSELADVVDGELQGVVRQLRASLAEPLRLAVVGRVSAGKSTLVNALVGRRVAPTSAGECTRVVTWYRYGTPDRAEIHLRDGTTRQLRLVHGALPDELGVRASMVEAVTVYLQAGALRDLTLIDTPGLDTLTTENETATRRAVLGSGEASQQAAGEADALLFMISDAARKTDLAFLSDFQATCGRGSGTSLNVIGVVSQADRFRSGPFDTSNPFQTARAIAGGLAQAHPAELSEVVAVSGLLAETARTGRITESLARRLAELAPLDDISLALRQQDSTLTDLFQALGPYGVTAGRPSAAAGGAHLRAWCEEISAVSELELAVGRHLVPHADLLKSSRALGGLTTIAAASHQRERALSLLENARLDPALHPVEELRALQLLRAKNPASPLTRQLRCLVEDHDRAVHLTAEADGGVGDPAAAARRCATTATRHAALAVEPAEVDAARVLARSYQLLARELAAEASVPSEKHGA